jgi:soluble lytic murein transglycosylase-like protein
MRMNRKTLVSLIVVVLLMTVGNSYIKSQEENEVIVDSNRDINYHSMKLINIDHKENAEEIEIIVERPQYDIPLSEELQQYIWELANKNEISYELVLAVMYLESRFDIGAVNRNNNGTKDKGIMQINSAYKEYHAENAGIEDFNIFDPYDNIKVGINVLVTERDYWRSFDMCEMDVFKYTMGSYNMGRLGIEKYGLPEAYINRVSDYKMMLETEGGFE